MKSKVVLAVTVLGVVTGCGPHGVTIGGAGGAADEGYGGEASVGGGFATGGSGSTTPFPTDSGGGPSGRAGSDGNESVGGSSGSSVGRAGSGGTDTRDGSGGYPADMNPDGTYGGGYGRAGGDPTGVAGSSSGGYAGDPSGVTGGSAGYGGNAGTACTHETIYANNATDGCEDDDVLLGRAYQVCVNFRQTLASVTFLERCSGGNMSRGLEAECCGSSTSGTAGEPGAGGAPE